MALVDTVRGGGNKWVDMPEEDSNKLGPAPLAHREQRDEKEDRLAVLHDGVTLHPAKNNEDPVQEVRIVVLKVVGSRGDSCHQPLHGERGKVGKNIEDNSRVVEGTIGVPETEDIVHNHGAGDG